MTKKRLCQTVAATLGLEVDEVSEVTTMQNCERWDSLQHFQVILAVERIFDVRFSSSRIPDLVSIEALYDEIGKCRSSSL